VNTKECFLKQQPIIFVGDSVARNSFEAFVKKINESFNVAGFDKHSDIKFIGSGLTCNFFWDPFLNNSFSLENGPGLLKLKELPKSATKYIFISSGLWPIKYEGSASFLNWISYVNRTVTQISKVDNVKIIFSHLSVVVENKLSEDKKNITNQEIQNYNFYIDGFSKHFKNVISFPAISRMEKDIPFLSIDGIHYEDAVYSSEADILLNYICVGDTVAEDASDNHGVCCQKYTYKWKQGFILFLSCSLILFHLFRNFGFFSFVDEFCSIEVSQSIAQFSGCLVFCFLADRTDFYIKYEKHFNTLDFGLLVFLTFVVGFLTLQGSKDASFLNRNQTDEWKGWMQLLILIYHYTGASKIFPIYNFIRWLVAAYLFMTGYGHFSYFYKNPKFSFSRFGKILIRLNIFPLILAGIMDTTFESYYFSPLVSMWFCIIYFIMYIKSSLNEKSWFILFKIVVSLCVTSYLVMNEYLFNGVVDIFSVLTGTVWDKKEWLFRVKLDCIIVYVGMIVAFLYLKLSSKYENLTADSKRAIEMVGLVVAFVVAFGYLFYETSMDKFSYNRVNYLISILPVLSFVVLRNLSFKLRSTTSTFFCYFGRISLETFILQFHIWLARDTRGILMIFPYNYYINLLLTSFLFVYVSNVLSSATSVITEWISNSEGFEKNMLKVFCVFVFFNYLPDQY
jgi:hypothetical protein